MKLFGSIKELVSAVFRKDTYEITLRPNQSTTYTAARDVQLPAKDGNAVLVSSGDIVNADINASAAIADTKLATISTAGKVSNSATTATDANTPSAIVARDGSGNFSAGTITASLSGNASTATTATSFSGSLSGEVTGTQSATVIASGVIDNDNIAAAAGIVDTKLATISTAGKVSNSATTATSTNTASAIVARDSSGNFAAGTASLSGATVSGLTASQAVVTDASKNLSSLAYTSNNTGSTLMSRDVAGSTSVNTLSAGSIDVTNLATMNKAYIDGPSGDGFIEFEGQTVADVPAPTTGEARIFAGTDGKIYVRKAGSSQAEELGAGGSGEVNLVETPSDAGSWVGVNATVTTNTTAANNPLAGVIDSSISIASSTLNGYARTRFTMPSALKNRKLKLEWFQIASGLASGAYKVEVYTNSASNYGGTYTELALSTDSSGTSNIPNLNGKYSTTFDANGSDYYEIRIVRTAASAATLYVANVVCGPGIQPQGAVVQEWQSFTPTFAGFGTPTLVGLWWRRVGASMQIRGRFTSGTTTATTASFTLPNNLTIDASAISNQVHVVGKFWRDQASSNAYKQGALLAANSATMVIQFSYDDTAAAGSPLTAVSGNTLGVTGLAVSIICEVPIAEWAGSGTVQLAQNDVEYASNSGNVTAAGGSDTTSFAYGPGGSSILAYNSTTVSSVTSFTVQFQTPIQSGDQVVLELSSDGLRWTPVSIGNAGTVSGLTFQSTAIYGAGVRVTSATQAIVEFGNAGRVPTGGVYGAVASSWSGATTLKWRVRKSSAGAAVGFGIVSSGQAGLLPASNSNLDDATATRLGLKQYQHGTTYSGGIAPTVTCAQAGFAVVRAVFIPYQAQDGAWRLRFNLDTTITSATLSVITITINGTTFKNVSGFNQPISAFCNGGPTPQGRAATNTGNLQIYNTSASGIAGYGASGDVELESKPTWAY